MPVRGRHVRGRPRAPFRYPDWPLYVRESRYNDRERVVVTITNWHSCITEEVRKKEIFTPIYMFERPIYPRRFLTPFGASSKPEALGDFIQPTGGKAERWKAVGRGGRRDRNGLL